MRSSAVGRRSPAGKGQRVSWLPATQLGRWAVGLEAAAVALVGLGPARVGIPMGIAGGIAALVAVLRRGERSVAVFAVLVPWLVAVGFVLAELLGGRH